MRMAPRANSIPNATSVRRAATGRTCFGAFPKAPTCYRNRCLLWFRAESGRCRGPGVGLRFSACALVDYTEQERGLPALKIGEAAEIGGADVVVDLTENAVIGVLCDGSHGTCGNGRRPEVLHAPAWRIF